METEVPIIQPPDAGVFDPNLVVPGVSSIKIGLRNFFIPI